MAKMLRRFKSQSEDCKNFVATKVPNYAIPNFFVPLARMPLDPNGNVDKPSLPLPDAADFFLTKRRSSSATAKMTDTQIRLARCSIPVSLESLASEINRAQDPICLRLDAMPLSANENVEDEAYAAYTRGLARQLPEFIRSAAADYDFANTPPIVFLIGATGFLGSCILHELLDDPTKARVIAHVRTEDAAAGLNRLESTMNSYGL
ncbi:MAG: hypothetical protein Q9164_005913 [Protoblastenia rupestris]